MPRSSLAFVTCATRPAVLSADLLASPCLASRRYPVAIYLGCESAAAAFNAEMRRPVSADWLVWVHQDVFLPADWDLAFLDRLHAAEQAIDPLGVVGVYGIGGDSPDCRRLGHLVDRGRVVRESPRLPAVASSLDEVLFAVRVDSALTLDPSLGFDFYGTDLVLSAKALGWQAAVIDAPCEHRSVLPRSGALSPASIDRFVRSGEAFEAKWAHAFPIETACLCLREPGDTARFVSAHFTAGALP